MKHLFKYSAIIVLLSDIIVIINSIVFIFKYKKFKNIVNIISFFALSGIILGGLFARTMPILKDNYITFGISVFLYTMILAKKSNDTFFELITLTNTLEQKVFERTQQLEHANRQKTEAFINISHEIKTPATIVSNYLEQHIKEHGSTEALRIAEQNINKLKRDMLNVLDFEKLDKGMAFYDHSLIADLSDVVKKNILIFAEIALRKGLNLKYDDIEGLYKDTKSF